MASLGAEPAYLRTAVARVSRAAAAVGELKNGADVGGDGFFQVLARDVSLGILLEVELASVPGDGGEDGGEGGFETLMGVAGDGAGGGEGRGL